MGNNWNIPDWLEEKIRKRDKTCVFCHVEFKDNSCDRATWEHLDNDERNICEENITLCCHSCNASKGSKKLFEWIKSDYCRKKDINEATLANIVKNKLIVF